MKTVTYTEALRQALREEMERDDSVFLLGEDIGTYGGAFGVTRGLLDEYGPGRVMDTPISEQGFIGMAIGAAITGMRPVAEIMFMDFVTLIVDPMVNQAAKLHYVFGADAACPLVVRTAAGGGRCYGPTHSQMLESWFFATPGIKIAAPATPADAKGLLVTAIRDNNPVLFLEHKMLYGQRGPIPEAHYAIPFGTARHVAEGNDVTIVAWSWMSAEAEAALPLLDEAGVTADVIDLRTLAPLDTPAIVESVKRTGRLLIVEEGTRTGGVAAEIGQQVFEEAWDYMVAPIRRVTTPDIPLSASPSMESAAIPDRQRIAAEAIALVEL